MKKKLLFVFSVFLSISACFAQEIDKLGVDDLAKSDIANQQTVVSASRSAKKIVDLPVTIFVITKEQIQQNAYTTLVDVMKDIPGIKVSKPGSGVEGELFLLRGLRGNYYVKILINGVPINPSGTLGMPIGEQLPVLQAERIEVIYGPASALYGADALAGVVNIITKNGGESTTAQASTTIGQYGYLHTSFLVGGSFDVNKSKSKSIEYSFYGNSSQRRDQNIKYDLDNIWNPTNYNPDFNVGIPGYTPNYQGTNTSPILKDIPQKAYLIGANIKYKSFTLDIMKMYRKDHSSLGQDPASYFFYNPETTWGENITRIAGIYNKKIDKLSLTTNLSYLRYRLDNQSAFAFNFPGGVGGRVFKYMASDDLFFEQIAAYKVSPKLEITAGLNFQYSGNMPKTGDLDVPFDESLYQPFSTNVDYSVPNFGKFGINPVVFSNIAGFVQGYFNTEKWTFIAGLRYDKQSIFGDSFNPRLSALYKLNEKSSLRVSAGSAFKAPTTYYSYNAIAIPDAGTQVNYLNIPNPSLKAEIAQNYEIGYRNDINEHISLEIIAYFNQVKGVIDLKQVDIDKNKYLNASNTQTGIFFNDPNAATTLFGTQLILRFKNLEKKTNLNIDFYFSYTQGSEILTDLEKIPYFKDMPQVIAQLNFNLKVTPKLFLSVRNVGTTSWYARDIRTKAGFEDPTNKIKGYFVTDFTGSYKLNRNLQARLKVMNVFNVEYGGISPYGQSDMIYNPQLGRNIQGGFSFDF